MAIARDRETILLISLLMLYHSVEITKITFLLLFVLEPIGMIANRLFKIAITSTYSYYFYLPENIKPNGPTQWG